MKNFQRFLSLVIFIGLLMPFQIARAAGSLYVNQATGNDANSCLTAGDACATIQAAIVKASVGDTINAAGTYALAVNIDKALTLKGAQFDVNVSGRIASSLSESTIQGLVTVNASNVNINGFTLTNPGQTYALSITPSSSNIVITYNLVDTVGAVGLAQNVHSIVFQNGADLVTIAHNRFNNIKASNKSVSAIGVLDSASTNSSTGLLIQDNTFTDIASATSGAYGIIINNKIGAPDAQIKDNTFSGLNGKWTHAIGLEGPTPNAVVTGNINSLTATVFEKAAIFFEKNPVGNTVTVSNNQFNGTSFYGVAIHPNDLPGGVNGYSYIVSALNNWWGAVSGPASVGTGTGAFVGLNVNYDPWISTPSIVPAADTPTFCTGETSKVKINLNNIADLYGYQFVVNYDATKVSASGAFNNSFFDTTGDYAPWNATCSAGTCKFSVSKLAPQTPSNGSGTVAEITFTGLSAGEFDVTISNDILSDRDANAIGHAVGGPLHLTVCGYATASGVVSLQGRATPINAGTVTLTNGTFGSYSTNFDPITGAWSINNIKVLPGGTSYTFNAAHGLYLGNQMTHVLTGGGYVAPSTKLKGGDADNSGLIDVSDITCISGSFGGVPVTCGTTGSSDINADGLINILDLVLPGGNYGLSTPQGW